MIAPMNEALSDSSETTLKCKVFIAGGNNGQERMNSAEAYDPEFK
jgi:hypothetical protein